MSDYKLTEKMRKVLTNIVATCLVSLSFLGLSVFGQSTGDKAKDAADKMKEAGDRAADAVKYAADEAEEPKAAVRGRAFYEETGQPLRRAWISLVKVRNLPGSANADEVVVTGDWEFLNPQSVLTNDMGEFVIADVTPGIYQAVLKVPGIMNPSLADFENPVFQRFSFDGLSEGQIEVGVKRGGAISGFVRYQDGAPLIGAAVILLRVTGTSETGEPVTAPVPGLGKVETDDRGYYRFAGLPQGEFIIKTSEPSVFDGSNSRISTYSTDRYYFTSELQTYFPSGRTIAEAARLQVYPGEELQDIDVALAGRELFEVSGRVVGATNNALIDGIEIVFTKAEQAEDEEDYQSKEIRTTITDSEGRWKFKDMVPGKYLATISESSYRRYEEEEGGPPRTRPNYATSVHPFEVAVGENRDVIFRLAIEGSLSGIVSVDGGHLLPDQVQIFANTKFENVSSDSVETTDYESEEMQQKLRGEFKIQDLKEGEYFLDVKASDGFFAKSITYKGANILDKPLTIKAGQSLEGIRIVLGSGSGTISGSVKDSDSEDYVYAYLMPVRGDKTLTQSFLEADTDYIGSSGTFEFQAKPGEYYVFAAVPSETRMSTNATPEEREEKVKKLIENARRVTVVRGGTVEIEIVYKK